MIRCIPLSINMIRETGRIVIAAGGDGAVRTPDRSGDPADPHQPAHLIATHPVACSPHLVMHLADPVDTVVHGELPEHLTELVRDMPLDIRPAVVDVDGWDADRIWRLFTALEFRSLGARLFETLHPGGSAEWFADDTCCKAAHDAKALFHILRQRGWRIEGVTSDTLLGAYLVRPSRRSFALDELARHYLDRGVVIAAHAVDDGQLSLLDSPADDLVSPGGWLMEMARAVADLAVVLDRELDRIDSRARSICWHTATRRRCEAPWRVSARWSQTGVSTRRSTRPRRLSGDCRRQTRTCRIFPSGHRLVAESATGSSPAATSNALMTADYSQIEMRIMARLSNDAGLIEAFNLGEDLHNFVGARAFGVTIDEVTPEMRRRVKAMSYGLAYRLRVGGAPPVLRQPGHRRDPGVAMRR